MIPTWIIASILLSIFTLCSSSGLFQVRLTSQHTSSAQICVKKWRAKQFDSCLVESKLIPVGPDQQNIFELPFMFPWPTLFSLIVNSFDRNGVRLDSVIVQEQLGRNSGWKNGNKSPKDMAISYRILCQKSYFGIGCEKFCQNTDQYSCSSEGERLCKPGWTGDNCENAICSNGCSHGKCTSPDVCTCDPGFSGLACNQCQPRENCQHGSCQDNQPFTCACEPGWGGIFCERDLEFCARHSPCRNGGICSNGGSAGYTCSCPEGFIGSSCEIALPSICEHQGICRNGGTCVSGDTKMGRCMCADGFEGRYCQFKKKTPTCIENTCRNGGSCLNSSNICVCPICFSGPDCSNIDEQCLWQRANISQVALVTARVAESQSSLLILICILSVLLLAFCVVIFCFKYTKMKKLLRDPITQNSINEKKQIFGTPLKLGDENCKVYVIKSKDCKQPIISEYDSRYTTQPKAYRTFHHASDNSSSESENIYDEIDFREGNQAIDKPELTFIHDENNCIV